METLVLKKFSKTAVQLLDICVEHEIAALIIGLPVNMDGTEGRAVRKVRAVLDAIAEVTGLTIHEWDERLTTVAAERVLHQAGLSHLRRKLVVDQLSASLILQSFLGSRSNTHTP